MNLAENLRRISDSGYPEQELLYQQFLERIEDHREKPLLKQMAKAAKEGRCFYAMGHSLAPKELGEDGIRFLASEVMIAYW